MLALEMPGKLSVPRLPDTDPPSQKGSGSGAICDADNLDQQLPDGACQRS